MIGITTAVLHSALYATTSQQLPVCLSKQCPPASNLDHVPAFIIAAPDNFNPNRSPEPKIERIPLPKPIVPPKPVPQQPIPKVIPSAPPELVNTPRLTKEADKIAALKAWKYFERNWNEQTGLVNSVDNLPWTTMWDQGSALLGIHAARQLGLITADRFNQRMNTMLQTLAKLPLPATKLPNKAYSTHTAQMRQLNNTPDPQGKSGWSALDMARLLLGLHVMRANYPEHSDRINNLVVRWDLAKLVKDGWLQGSIPHAGGLQLVQEGRLGYEQYAAHSLKLWNIHAEKALQSPPVKSVKVDGVTLQVDERNFSNSGATNYLTNDPYLLWGLEMGWTDGVQPQVQNLLKLQTQRFKRTGILTAVNEDSLDRPPYFLYYSVYANGQPWQAVNTRGQAYPHLRFLSTKAAFAWSVLMPDDAYAQKIRNSVQNLTAQNRGYFSGKYENSKLGVNASVDINTNAIVLESLLYQARNRQPLVEKSKVKS